MNFIITEKNGDKPIEEFLKKHLKIYIEKELGIKVDIRFTGDLKKK